MDKLLLEDCCEILDSMRVPITSSDRVEGPYPYYGANGIQDHVSDYIFDDELVLLAEDGGNFGSKEKPIAYRVSGKCWVNNHAHVLKPKEGIDVDYLCYSLMFYNVGGMVNGATRQKLTQAAMRQMLIPKRTMEEQKHIVELLAKVVAVREKRQQELDELDNLIKARFVEMFGDIKTNNMNWDKVQMKNVVDIRGRVGWKGYKKEDLRENGPLVLGATHLTDSGDLDLSAPVFLSREKYEESPEIVLQRNDLIFTQRGNTIGKVGLVEHDIGEATINPCVLILRPQNVNPIYLKSYFVMDETKDDMWLLNSGSAQPMITQKGIGDYYMMLPPKELQDSFADFVKQVDKSKVVVQRSLDESQKLFDSLMQEYFG